MGVPKSKEAKEKSSKTKKLQFKNGELVAWNKGKTNIYSKKHIQNIKDSVSKKYKCEHCGFDCNHRNLTRWHGDNCKLNPNRTQESIDRDIKQNEERSAACKGKRYKPLKPVIQINAFTGEKIAEWESLIKASKELSINKSRICTICTKRIGVTAGFRWMYKEDYDKL